MTERSRLDRWRLDQEAVCDRFAVNWEMAPLGMKAGVALNVRSSLVPLNGLRHPPRGDSSGWYLWAGEELSEDLDFFVALHVEHLGEWCAAAVPYLGLPPGWRFLVAPGYEDVWFDESLLDV